MRAVLPVALSAVLLLWPAAWNGYPLVFSDTGTYLSQAVHHYLGWDRPVFYSLFLLPLHLTLTLWPIVVAQAVITAYVLKLTIRAFRPCASPPPPALTPPSPPASAGGEGENGAGVREQADQEIRVSLPFWRLPIVTLVLTITTSLPWFVDQVMPDLFTGLLVLALSLLVLVPERLGSWERAILAGIAGFSIAAHLSSLPLSLGLIVILLPLRRWLGAAMPLGRVGFAYVLLPPALAALAMTSVNFIGHGRVAIAPFGNVFLLTRVLYDGPGLDALDRFCPAAGWRLCAVRGTIPRTADEFLWGAGSPLGQVGGAKAISAEADAIVLAAIRAEPLREMRALLVNAGRQLATFSTGDGLQPWPNTVAPWIARDFPAAELRRFQRARQTTGQAPMPAWFQTLHTCAALGGTIAAAVLFVPALRRRDVTAGLILATVSALLLNAVITGGLSGPHARYQSRVMWLPVLAAVAALPGCWHLGLRFLSAARRREATGVRALNPSAVFWSGTEAAAGAGLSVVSAFVVARIIGPAEVGVGAAAVALNVLLWVAVNALFADAMVQRSLLPETDAASAFWASCAVGCLAACVQAAASWPLARSLGEPRLLAMGLALALPLPLVGAGGAIQGLLTRHRAYALLACRTLVGQGCGMAAALGCALGGGGAWSLVAQQATAAAVGALTLLLGARWRPRLSWQWQPVRDMLMLGTPLAASTLIQAGRYRMFLLFIGGSAGTVSLGQIHMAFRLVDTLRDLVFTALWRLMLPAMSESQFDLAALRAKADRFLVLSAWVLLPMCGCLLLGLRPLVAIALGPAWAPSGAAALLLVAATAWLFLTFPSGVAVVARGKPRMPLYVNIGFTLALGFGALLIRPATPSAAVWVWVIAQTLTAPFAVAVNARVLGTRVSCLLRPALPALLATAVAITCALLVLPELPNAERLAARLAVAGAMICAGGLVCRFLQQHSSASTDLFRMAGSAALQKPASIGWKFSNSQSLPSCSRLPRAFPTLLRSKR